MWSLLANTSQEASMQPELCAHQSCWRYSAAAPWKGRVGAVPWQASPQARQVGYGKAPERCHVTCSAERIYGRLVCACSSFPKQSTDDRALPGGWSEEGRCHHACPRRLLTDEHIEEGRYKARLQADNYDLWRKPAPRAQVGWEDAGQHCPLRRGWLAAGTWPK